MCFSQLYQMMDIGNILLIVLWGVFVGMVFSSIGAAGGILSSFGLITFFAVADPNSVKPMAQSLTLVASLVFIPGYFKRKAWVLPLGFILSAGGIIGAISGSTFSSLYLSDMSKFKPWFGLLALFVFLQISWKLYSEHKQGKKVAQSSSEGVQDIQVNFKRMSFSYNQQSYDFSVYLPFFAGFLIAFIAAVFGVGGGFLLVPFMASMLGMPMYIIPATAALAIFISSSISVFNYVRLGANLDYHILIPLVIGAAIGALFGPKINQMVKESYLQATLALIVFIISIKYMFSL
jgi:uncharacterized membrane protein YfcA